MRERERERERERDRNNERERDRALGNSNRVVTSSEMETILKYDIVLYSEVQYSTVQ